MQRAVNRTRQANIPLVDFSPTCKLIFEIALSYCNVSPVSKQDVQWADIDVMDRRLDFTYDPQTFANFPAYIEGLKSEGVRFVPIVVSFSGKTMQYTHMRIHEKLSNVLLRILASHFKV